VLLWANVALAQVPLIECPGNLTRISADRLVRDLEKLIAEYPDEPRIRHELGRVHLTAFVERKSTLRACSVGVVFHPPRGNGPVTRTGLPWGPEVPVKDDWRPRPAEEDDSREGVRAREHLRKAIQRFEEAIARTPARYGESEYVQGSQWLGYAWALQQHGAPRDQVIDAYRTATTLSWPIERYRNLTPPPIPVRKDVPGTFTSPDILRVSETVARWLIPLLDPIRDQAEIATLSERAAALAKERKARTK
jgi:hypothetical protein